MNALCPVVLFATLALPVASAAPRYVIERAFPKLTFTRPVYLTAPRDGTNRIFVVERGGTIRWFQNDDAVTKSTLFLDLSGVVSTTAWEDGLLGLALSPDFAQSGELYVYFTAESPLRVELRRYRVLASDPSRADPDSAEILITAEKDRGQVFDHFGGQIEFGPDGMLYVGLGDTGIDPLDHSQSFTSLWGKILRIDPRHGKPAYEIPKDNPFVQRAASGDGTRAEIYATGLRNPWRFSFDRVTGKLWVGDVGQNDREEIDIVTAGGNYGWPYYEGTKAYLGADPMPAAYVPPIHEFTHAEGKVVIGGYVYRGKRVPSLVGAYVYGDFGLLSTPKPVWALRYDDATGAVTSNEQIGTFAKTSSFGEDEAGELYITSLNDGTISRIVEATP